MAAEVEVVDYDPEVVAPPPAVENHLVDCAEVEVVDYDPEAGGGATRRWGIIWGCDRGGGGKSSSFEVRWATRGGESFWWTVTGRWWSVIRLQVVAPHPAVENCGRRGGGGVLSPDPGSGRRRGGGGGIITPLQLVPPVA